MAGGLEFLYAFEEWVIISWVLAAALWDYMTVYLWGPYANVVVMSLALLFGYLLIANIAKKQYHKPIRLGYLILSITMIVWKIAAYALTPSYIARQTKGATSSISIGDWPLLVWGIVALIIVLALSVIPYILNRGGFFSVIGILIFFLLATALDLFLTSWPINLWAGIVALMAGGFLWALTVTLSMALKVPGIKPGGG